jgi:hypothetical protein
VLGAIPGRAGAVGGKLGGWLAVLGVPAHDQAHAQQAERDSALDRAGVRLRAWPTPATCRLPQCPVTLADRHVAAPIGVLAILMGQVLSGEDSPA